MKSYGGHFNGTGEKRVFAQTAGVKKSIQQLSLEVLYFGKCVFSYTDFSVGKDTSSVPKLGSIKHDSYGRAYAAEPGAVVDFIWGTFCTIDVKV